MYRQFSVPPAEILEDHREHEHPGIFIPVNNFKNVYNDIGDIGTISNVGDENVQICHSNISPIYFASNFRHQHRCYNHFKYGEHRTKMFAENHVIY